MATTEQLRRQLDNPNLPISVRGEIYRELQRQGETGAVNQPSVSPSIPPPSQQMDIKQPEEKQEIVITDTQQLTKEDRSFSVKPGWKPIEYASARNINKPDELDYTKPTVYLDKDGIRHYTPYSTMWEMGYKTGGRMVDGYIKYEEGGDKIPGVYTGDPSGQNAYVAIGDKHITRQEAKELSKLDPDTQAAQLFELVGNKDDMLLPDMKVVSRTEYNSWSPDIQQIARERGYGAVVKYLGVKESEYKNAVGEIEKQIYSKDTPEVLQAAYRRGGIEEYKNAVKKYNQDIELENRLDKALFEAALKEQPEKLQTAYNIGGMEEYYKTLNRLQVDQNDALNSLRKYQDESGYYDIARYLRDNPKGQSTLKDAGFNNDDIGNAEKRNSEKQYISQFIPEYFNDRNWEYGRNKLVKAYNKASGDDIDKAQQKLNEYDERLAKAQKAYIQKYGGGEFVKEVAWTGGEKIIPGLSEAHYWAQMDTKQKVTDIAIDVASLALIMFGGKILGTIGKSVTGGSKIEIIAESAGKSGKYLKMVTKEYENALLKGEVIERGIKVPASQEKLSYLAMKVQKAQAQSLKADKALLDNLNNTTSISKAEIKVIERKSGLTGLSDTITDVNKSVAEVNKAWDNAEKIQKAVQRNLNKKINKAETERLNNVYLQSLERVEQAKSRLIIAENKAIETLKPRYKQPTPASRFEGYKIGFEKIDKQALQKQQNILDDLNEWLGRTQAENQPLTGLSKRPTLTIPKIETKIQPASKIKIKGEYSKTPLKPEAKPNIPKVKGSKPDLKTASITEALTVTRKGSGIKQTTEVPSQAYGTMTQEQIRRLYGTEVGGLVDVRSRKLDDALTWVNNNTSTQEWLGIKEQLTKLSRSTGNEALIAETSQTIKNKLDNMAENQTGIQQKAQAKNANKVISQALYQTLTQTATKTNLTTKQDVKTPKPPLPFMKEKYWYRKLFPPNPNASDEVKRNYLKKVPGFIARRRGSLHGQDMFLINFWPYGEKDRLVIIGQKPEGAKLVRGKGSLAKSVVLIRGVPPEKPIYENTGAIDDVITARGRDIKVVSVPDKVKNPRTKIKTRDIGGGIEVNKEGRGHIKI